MSQPQQIYVNLPVKDLARSKEFFAALGYTFEPTFTDEKAACLVLGENIYAMLLVEEFFQTFTGKRPADTTTTTEAILALSVPTRERVDELVDKALAAGGTAAGEPADHGWMYYRSVYDPDGHHWEFLWMDVEAAQAAAQRDGETVGTQA